MGEPFTSRRKNHEGLAFPNVEIWPNFVCELCTVEAMLQRPVGHCGDLWLLHLERARIIDTAHSAALGTLSTYQTQLRKVRLFEKSHPGLHVLPPDRLLEKPATGTAIATIWTELDYSVKLLPATKRLPRRHPTYGTVRQIRAAVSSYLTGHMITSVSGGTRYSENNLVYEQCRATDGGDFSAFAKGMKARMGDHSVASKALLRRHIEGLDNIFEREFIQAHHPSDRWQWALAGLANSLLWLGWLRGGEAFGFKWSDVKYISSREGSAHDLPPGLGALIFQLGPETKSERNKNVDVVISSKSASGLNLGKWYRRVFRLRPKNASRSEIFLKPDLQPWDSYYYRYKYLYPSLVELGRQGDTALKGLSLSELQNLYWSLHSYRRGARTDCQRARPGTGLKVASKAQVYEHARWRHSRSSEDIDALYREWNLYDRISITATSH